MRKALRVHRNGLDFPNSYTPKLLVVTMDHRSTKSKLYEATEEAEKTLME